uniref:Uncharacterized protein n=1 Tax=Aegilops tauschii TaxID=37682 RepID=M8AVC9_AEGTA
MGYLPAAINNGHPWLYHMAIGKPLMRVELLYHLHAEGMWIRVETVHVVHEWRQSDSDTIRTNLMNDGINYLHRKAEPVLEAATVPVGTRVPHGRLGARGTLASGDGNKPGEAS